MKRQGVKPAAQTRSKKSRDALVAALETLLRKKAFEDITIAEIARTAGLSVGAVYGRFENKDAFIPVIFDLYRVRQEKFATSPDARYVPDRDEGLRAALRKITAISWVFLERETHLIRATHLYGRLRPDLVGDEWDEMLETGVASYRAIIEHFAEEISHTDHDEAARMLAYMMSTLSIERGLYPTEGAASALKMDDTNFNNAIADAMYGYLTVANP